MNNLNKSSIIIKKAVIFCLMLFSLAIFLLPNISLAASGPDQLLFGGSGIKTQTQSILGLGSNDPRIIIASVIRVILGFLGILAVGLIMYGGWLYMTSQGEEDKIKTAKDVITNAVIGLVIILSAFALATFILNWLYNGTTGNGNKNPGDLPGDGHGIGIIGACSVESVFPEPFQEDVPRNTAIIVTFKEEIKPESICANLTSEGKCQDGSAIKKIDNLLVARIYQSAQSDKCGLDNQESCVSAKIYTRDNKTFVFLPDSYLGSPSEKIWYSVHLTNDIQNMKNEGIFSHCRGQDYLEWSFDVSTKLDLTPPKVLELEKSGVFPLPALNQGDNDTPKNTIIKINFNEGVNPYTISGDAEAVSPFIRVVCDGCADSEDIFDCGNSQKCVKGNFEIANAYRTVEFISKNKCGTNNCGEDIFCLPGGEKISVLLNAASLAVKCSNDNDCITRSPYSKCGANNICQDQNQINYPMGQLDGVIDLAMNSLDGNRNNNAEGNGGVYNENIKSGLGDNYTWSFWTSNEFRNNPPEIRTVTQKQDPDFTDLVSHPGNIHLSNPLVVNFSELMMSSSLKTYPVTILNNIHEGVNLLVLNKDHKINLASTTNYWLTSEDAKINTGTTTTLFINHDILLDKTNYRGQIGSRAKDIYQNCYMPCVGPGCIAADTSASCCNGAPKNNSNCD